MSLGLGKKIEQCPDPISTPRLERWVDGITRGEERREIDDHIARCPACRERAEVIAGRRMAGF